MAEWERAPVGLLEEILEARSFARAKELYDDAQRRGKGLADLPPHPMIALVQEIEFALAREELKDKSDATDD